MGGVEAWKRLPYHKKALLEDLHVSEKLLVVGQLLQRGPLQRVLAKELEQQVGRLAAFLSDLSASPPLLVTIARTADAFAGIFDVPALEDRVLRLLRKVWGTAEGADSPGVCVRYAPGTAPLEALPVASDFINVSS